MTTWRKEFKEQRNGKEDRSAVVAVAPNEAVLDVEFNAGYGTEEGPHVLIWTEERVYYNETQSR